MVGRLSDADVKRIAHELALELAQDRAAESTPAAAQTADGVAVVDGHKGPSGKLDGRRYPCTADGGCGLLLRSKSRAAIHSTNVKESGHADRRTSEDVTA